MKRNKPLRSKTPLRSKKDINPIGRIGRYRQRRRKQWIEDHPPDELGFYICYLCDWQVHYLDMELDHEEPKGSTPADIAESDKNMKPTHPICNKIKGSRRL